MCTVCMRAVIHRCLKNFGKVIKTVFVILVTVYTLPYQGSRCFCRLPKVLKLNCVCNLLTVGNSCCVQLIASVGKPKTSDLLHTVLLAPPN